MNRQTTANRFAFAVRRSDSDYSSDVALIILDPADSMRELAQITWTTRRGNDHWNGGWIRAEALHRRQLMRALAAVPDVPAPETCFTPQPADYLAAVRAQDYEPAVYDPRSGLFAALATLEPGDQYTDDYNACGYAPTYIRALAGWDADARAGIAAEFARRAGRRDSTLAGAYATCFAQWVAAGMPVILLERRPETPDFDALVQVPAKAEPEPALTEEPNASA